MRKHNFILSFITAMTILAAVEAKGAEFSWEGDKNVVPRLVVNILVDQLRSDYLEAFSPLYGEDGLQRLMRQGRLYEQAEYPLARPDRASAAATLATGTTAADHVLALAQSRDTPSHALRRRSTSKRTGNGGAILPPLVECEHDWR